MWIPTWNLNVLYLNQLLCYIPCCPSAGAQQRQRNLCLQEGGSFYQLMNTWVDACSKNRIQQPSLVIYNMVNATMVEWAIDWIRNVTRWIPAKVFFPDPQIEGHFSSTGTVRTRMSKWNSIFKHARNRKSCWEAWLSCYLFGTLWPVMFCGYNSKMHRCLLHWIPRFVLVWWWHWEVSFIGNTAFTTGVGCYIHGSRALIVSVLLLNIFRMPI